MLMLLTFHFLHMIGLLDALGGIDNSHVLR